MKKNLFLRLCLMITVALSLHSCRSEDFLQDKEKSKEDFKVSLLNRQQLDQQKPLLQELSKLKSKFRYKNIDRKLGKSAQDDIFEGAIIGTNQVLLIEKNGNKTYTFPVYRTYLSDKTESLIVKENEDHTFSGILVQYDLTKEEKQQFLTGQNTEINSKIKIFDVDKLNLNAKTNVDVIGCFVITWETGWCSANVHYTGGPGGCTVGGAPAPMIQSIEYVCENGNPADNGESGESGSTGPVVGAGIDLGAYFSIPFISIGYQYYETEDDLDPNYLHYMSVVNYFSSLGTTLNQLRTTNPDLFYYTFFYFKDNGINPTTKAFITQRLAGLNAWYVAVNNNPNSIPANNQYFLNWAYEYLVLNPDVTWEEFYDQYLATPCDKIKKQKENTDFNNKITDLQGKTGLKKETGYIQKYGGDYVYKDNASATDDANSLSLPQVATNTYIKGFMHTHVNDFTTSDGDKRKGVKMFSPADVVYFMDLVQNAQTKGQQLSDVYAVMVTNTGNYQIRFTGSQYQIKTFTDQEKENHKDPFTEIMKEYIGNSKQLELKFLKYIQEKMLLYGITLYRMNTDGTTTEIKLNADKTDTVENTCPN